MVAEASKKEIDSTGGRENDTAGKLKSNNNEDGGVKKYKTGKNMSSGGEDDEADKHKAGKNKAKEEGDGVGAPGVVRLVAAGLEAFSAIAGKKK